MSDLSPSPNTISPPSGSRSGRRSGPFRLINLVLLIAIIAVIALFFRAEQQRRATANQLAQTERELQEVRKSTRAGGEEVAKQVLEKLRRHMNIPTDPAPTVATIVDINRLREANAFYNAAENGDHLIITEKRAILYDPERDLILDVVPVAIDTTRTSPGASPAGTPTGTPRVSATPTPRPSASPSPTAAP